MAKHLNFYQRVELYDIALRRPVDTEVDFFMELYKQHTGKDLESFLEIACGPAYHGIEMALRDIHVTCLDLLPEMISFARYKAEEEDVDINFVASDMRDFDLEQSVDMAVCLFDAIDVLLDNDSILAHLDSVARNMNKGGIYVIQNTHPALSAYGEYGQFSYEGERNGTKVELRWATNNPIFDPITGIAQVDIEIHITENDLISVIYDTANERMTTPSEWALMARLSGEFEPIAWYGNFDINQPLDNSPNAEYAVIVLRRL